MNRATVERIRRVRAYVVPGKGTLTDGKPPEQPARRAEIEELTGVVKVPGSLNLRTLQPQWFDRRAATHWSGGYLFPARIGPHEVVLNKQLDRIAIQPHLMHVYASVRLRDALHLADGDEVEVDIPENCLLRSALLHDAVYAARRLRRRVVRRVGGRSTGR